MLYLFKNFSDAVLKSGQVQNLGHTLDPSDSQIPPKFPLLRLMDAPQGTGPAHVRLFLYMM